MLEAWGMEHPPVRCPTLQQAPQSRQGQQPPPPLLVTRRCAMRQLGLARQANLPWAACTAASCLSMGAGAAGTSSLLSW